MKIIVCGGRVFQDTVTLHQGLDMLHARVPITEVIEGGAPGADVRGGEWADKRGIEHTIVEAEWELHGRKAGYLRNVAMADLKPDVVFAAPGGKGTAMMVDIAAQRGIPVVYLEKMGLNPRKGLYDAEPLDAA